MPDNDDKAIKHPAHYNHGPIETIDYLVSMGWGEAFCAGNVVKYVSRYKAKDGLKDLRKAKEYLQFLTDIIEGKWEKHFKAYTLLAWDSDRTVEEIARIVNCPICKGKGSVGNLPCECVG